ncbi:hypothetical protein [Sphingomonas elodea]|uniref:hypothetical protein n=1 Tax=Sphingomonas elodea TaxID=179878 RepID=UPI00026312DE|nr:hypothetical protein [Sphingomonas elodea]
MIPQPQRIALALAGIAAAVLPVLLLTPGKSAPSAPVRRASPLGSPTEPPLAHVFDRPLFAAPVEPVLPPDAPVLTGVVGRLGSDAVALVRTAQGTSRTLAIGDSIDGWRLESLSIDAALFSRGGQRARVPMPAAEPAPPAQ